MTRGKKRRTGNIRRLLIPAAVVLTFALAAGVLCGCSAKKPPALEDVYDIFVDRTERSQKVNVVLFGSGLPVYARDSEESILTHRYYGQGGTLETVKPTAPYQSVGEIKADAAAVYSKSYCDSLFESTFTGYSNGGSSVMPSRYADSDMGGMTQNSSVSPLVRYYRVFDYSTMEIVDGSTDTYVRVKLMCRTTAPDSEWHVTRLAFVYEDGEWKLDGPSC